jgi:hypothetical protein
MVPFLRSVHCKSVFTVGDQLVMSTLNERQLVRLVGELGEFTFVFMSRLRERMLEMKSFDKNNLMCDLRCPLFLVQGDLKVDGVSC